MNSYRITVFSLMLGAFLFFGSAEVSNAQTFSPIRSDLNTVADIEASNVNQGANVQMWQFIGTANQHWGKLPLIEPGF